MTSASTILGLIPLAFASGEGCNQRIAMGTACLLYTSFVVVHKITNRKVYISDPAQGLTHYNHKEFREAWEMCNGLGTIMILETTPEFHNMNEMETRASFSHFMKYLKPHHRYLGQVIVGMVAGILIGLLSPFISQSIVDFGIGSGNIQFEMCIRDSFYPCLSISICLF